MEDKTYPIVLASSFKQIEMEINDKIISKVQDNKQEILVVAMNWGGCPCVYCFASRHLRYST